MATKNETATVTVTINGNQASDTMKSLRQDVNKLTADLAKLPIGTEAFNKKLDELKNKKQILEDVKKQVQNTSSAWEKMLNVAGGMGIYEIARKGLSMLGQAIGYIATISKSADSAADKWEQTITGLTFAWDTFKKALATGDFTNLIRNMELAIQKGKEYAKTIDDISERTQAMSLYESNQRVILEQLKTAERNVALTKEERLDAGIKALAIEKDLMNRNVGLAKERTQAEMDRAEFMSGLDQSTIKKYLAEREQNKALIEESQRYLEIQKQIAIAESMDSRNQDKAARIDALQKESDLISSQAKIYSGVVAGMGKLSNEPGDSGSDVQRLIDNMNAENAVRISAEADSRRIILTESKLRMGILADEENAEEKVAAATKKAAKDQVTALEELSNKLKEYEIALQNAVINGDSKEAQVYADKVARIKAYKQSIEDLIKALQDQADSQVTVTPMKPVEFDASQGLGGGSQGNVGIGLGKPGAGEAVGVGNPPPKTDEPPEWVAKAQDVIGYAETVSTVLSQVDQMMSAAENQQLARDQATNEQKKANFKKQLDSKQITEKQYNEAVAKMEADLDKERRKIAHDQAVRQKELALVQTIINVAQGIAAAMTMTPPASFIMAALTGVLGAIQIGTILSQKVPQAARGKYNVIGEEDGRLYSDVSYGGSPQTGIYARPTLISEHGGELVVDAPTTKNLQMNYPWIIEAVNNARVPQHASGSYPSTSASMAASDKMLSELQTMNRQMQETNELARNTNTKLTNLRAKIVYDDLEEAQSNVESIRSNARKE